MKTAPPFFRHGPGPFAKLIVFTCLSCLLIVEDLRFKRFHEVRQIIGTVIFPLQRIAYAPTFIYDEVKNFIVHFNLLEENAKLKMTLFHLLSLKKLINIFYKYHKLQHSLMKYKVVNNSFLSANEKIDD